MPVKVFYLKQRFCNDFFSLFAISVYERVVKSKENLISFVKDCLPGYSLQPVIGDGLCILRSFVVGISNGLCRQT